MNKHKSIFDSDWDKDDDMAGLSRDPINNPDGYVKLTSDIVLDIDWGGELDLPTEYRVLKCICCNSILEGRSDKVFCSPKCRKKITRMIDSSCNFSCMSEEDKEIEYERILKGINKKEIVMNRKSQIEEEKRNKPFKYL